MTINYIQFLNMIPEATLVAMLIFVFLVDFCSSNKTIRKWFNPLVCVLMALQVVACVVAEPAEAFGSMYVSTVASNVMKVILTAGTLIVLIMSKAWVETPKVSSKL